MEISLHVQSILSDIEGKMLQEGVNVDALPPKGTVVQSLNEANALLMSAIGRFVEPVYAEGADDSLGVSDRFVYRLILSPRRSVGKTQALTDFFHLFLVETVIAKCYTNSGAGDLAAKHNNDATAAVQSIVQLLHSKIPPMAYMEYVKREPREKERKITLHKAEILQDIDTLSYKLSETTGSGDNVASDAEDSLDSAIISQMMQARDSQLRKKLAFCLKEEEVIEVDNTATIEEDFVYELLLPLSFADSSLKVAVQLMHNYIVRGTLLDWYTQIGTQYGAPLVTEVNSLESQIVDIFRVPGFVKHPSMPYMKSYKIR